MAKPLNPASFAALGRDYLIALPFAPVASTTIWKQFRTPASWIAQRLCVDFPAEMAALRDKIEARPTPKPTAAAPRGASAAKAEALAVPVADHGRHDEIAQAFHGGSASIGSTRFNPMTQIQEFGGAR